MRDYAPAPIELVRELPQFFAGGQGLDYAEAGIGEVQLRQYWRIVAKYRRLIGGITVVAAFIAVVYAFTRTRQYTAETQVRISTYEPVLAATKIEDLLHERSREGNYFETQIQEIKSRSLADRVLEDPQVRAAYEQQTKEGALYRFASGENKEAKSAGSTDNGNTAVYKAPVSLLDAYSQSISVEPLRRTSLVNIRVTLPDPGMAALVADRHARSYIDWVKFVRVEQQSRGLKFLENQANEQRDRVAELERELAEYAESNSIVALNKDQNITVQKMAQLNELLTAAVARRIEAENSYREARESQSGTGSGFDDASMQNIRTELARLQAEYRQLSAKFTDSYPRMQQLKAQIEAVRGSLSAQQQQITLGLKAKAEAAQMQENNLREELEKQKSLAFELSRKQVQYNILNRELTASRELLENVLRQMKETAVSVEGSASNVSIVDPAVVPLYPSYPKKKMMVMMGTLLGLAIGLGIAFLLNYLDNTVRTPEDIQYLLQLPTLGVVPAFELDFQSEGEGSAGGAKGEETGVIPSEEGGKTLPVIFHQAPKSLSSEAYRTIRTGLLLSQAGSPPHTMLFTSAQSSEGKTTTALNIAASLASSGGNVLVIDADLRRPSVLRGLSLETTAGGLVEVLTGQVSVEDVLVEGAAKGFTVLPSGRIPPNPAELLGSPQMADLIDYLTRRFDYIIIDSPPVLPVTDSMLLSRYVDGVVLVVKGKATPRKVIKDAYERLASVGAHQLGVVLNDVDVRGGDYYYYNRYYYSYYQTGEGRAA